MNPAAMMSESGSPVPKSKGAPGAPANAQFNHYPKIDDLFPLYLPMLPLPMTSTILH